MNAPHSWRLAYRPLGAAPGTSGRFWRCSKCGAFIRTLSDSVPSPSEKVVPPELMDRADAVALDCSETVAWGVHES
jgi:hypothetical protein